MTGGKMSYFVYILTNQRHTVLYTGVTNNLERRMHEHRAKTAGSFTARFNVDKLVYFEETPSVEAAISREKSIKGITRVKKIDLINEMNAEWNDLSLF
jgi:putative endonuclease